MIEALNLALSPFDAGQGGVIGSELDAGFCEYAAIRRPMRSSNHFMGQNFSCLR